MSSYLRFAADLRQKQGLKDMKSIGEVWRKASPAEKQAFDEVAHAEQAAYKVKFEEYKSSGKMQAFDRDPAKPRRPTTGYFLWAQEQRAIPEIANMPVAESAKLLGSKWATLPDGIKAPLFAKGKADMAQFTAALKAYKESGAERAWLEKTGRLGSVLKSEAKKQAEQERIQLLKGKAKAKAENSKSKALAEAAGKKENKILAKEKLAAAKEKAKVKRAAAKEKKAAAVQKAKEKAREKAQAAKARAAKKAQAAQEKTAASRNAKAAKKRGCLDSL